ncbi:aminotransferase DegT [Desulfosarcina alkanivorans]|uniref:Aminotransferase DegT n=1 Tax=Desulfosarcina alkanivorans TaxID=571177 RepID=A0A5K7YEG0_9BACT|nr:aminotransferase class I/II-fold pyridoxal phosphate-dependent enzyme [Desulfosarcina alkanivorans]BBO67892.1 aminotransferase DegT [Desulfosarcina alkanivorans]
MDVECSDPLVFTKEFTRQEPLPEESVRRAVAIMESGRLHRYNTAAGETAEAALLETEFAAYMGTRYCLACASCGSAIYLALESAGVRPGDAVLCNAYTLAPVPGAIENAGGRTILVEITDDYTIDLDDLDRKAAGSGARFFLLSHMRGHIADMDRIMAACRRHGLVLIEDCAHTMGARWDGKRSGTFGAVACYSTQTYKHMNSGEGGLLVTDDDDVMARAILFSGSYMLYERHVSRPSMAVFDKYKTIIPNFSMRMDNLRAALLRPQLRRLDTQCRRWNERYRLLETALNAIDHVQVPVRDRREAYVGSSIQFTLQGVNRGQVENFLAGCAERGVEIKWFGWSEPNGFTSSFDSWAYIQDMPDLPATRRVLDFMCDFRIPLTFSLEDCRLIARIIQDVIGAIVGTGGEPIQP